MLGGWHRFICVGRNISVMVGRIKKLRPLYEVQLLETFQIQQLNLHQTVVPEKKLYYKIKSCENPKRHFFFTWWFLGFTATIIM